MNFLFVLLPPALVTGPFLSDLIVSLMGLSIIILSFYKKLWHIYKNKFSIIFSIFYVYLIFVSLIGNDPLNSFESSLFYFRFYFFSIAVFYIIDTNSKILKYFLISLLCTFSILIIDSVFQYIFGFNLIGLDRSSDYLSSFFGDKHILGSYISRLSPLVFLLFFLEYKKNNYINYLYLILIPLLLLVVFLSGERAALFNFSLLILLFILFTKNIFRFKIFLLSILSILLVLMFTFMPKKRERMIEYTLWQFGFNVEIKYSQQEVPKQKYIFSEKHQILYNTAIRIFISNPLFGQGPKSFRNLCSNKKYFINENSCNTHPHNTYIQLLAETGIFGFLMILLIYFWVIYKFYSNYLNKHLETDKVRNINVCLLIYFLISLWPFIPTGSFFNNYLNIIYFIPVGIYLAYNRRS